MERVMARKLACIRMEINRRGNYELIQINNDNSTCTRFD
jgi:hypothetical protein